MAKRGDIELDTKVNAVRAMYKLPPLSLPDGTPNPDGELTMRQLAQKRSPDGRDHTPMLLLDNDVQTILSALMAYRDLMLVPGKEPDQVVCRLITLLLSAVAVTVER